MALTSGLLSADVSITIRSMSHRESTITDHAYQSLILCLSMSDRRAWWWGGQPRPNGGFSPRSGCRFRSPNTVHARLPDRPGVGAGPAEFSRLLIAAVIGYFVSWKSPA